jgi:branched-chain amino acid aminotransferase
MYYDDKTEIYLDGQFCRASEVRFDFFSQTLHYGNGVFEGIRAYETGHGTQIFKAEAHYERLIYSAEKMLLPFSYTVAQLTELSYELLRRNHLSDAYIRPLVYAGPAMGLVATEETHLLLTAFEWGRLLGDQEAHIMTSSYTRPHPASCHVEAKVCGHYINSILAKTDAKQKGFDEALLLDTQGFVAEASGANLFFEQGEVLYTPPRGNILPGITRATIFELAAEMGVPVVERLFRPEDLYEADGAFLVGTAAEVAPVGTVDGHRFSLAWEDTLGYLFARKYRQLVTQNDDYQRTLI